MDDENERRGTPVLPVEAGGVADAHDHAKDAYEQQTQTAVGNMMSEPAVVFVLRIDPKGQLSWNSTLAAPLLNLALDRVKAGIIAGQVKEENAIVPPTNGDVNAVRRLRP